MNETLRQGSGAGTAEKGWYRGNGRTKGKCSQKTQNWQEKKTEASIDKEAETDWPVCCNFGRGSSGSIFGPLVYGPENTGDS